MKKDMLLGINTNGPRTYGSSYARNNPEGLPDAIDEQVPNFGKKVAFGKIGIRVGGIYRVCGIWATVLAAKAGAAVVLDTRRAPPEFLDANLRPDMLVLWQGYYWRVQSVHGVNVILSYRGPSKHLPGSTIYTRDGKEYVKRNTR